MEQGTWRVNPFAAPASPTEREAIAQLLAQSYADAQQEILGELAQQDLTSWGVAFRRQQLAQVDAILQKLEQPTLEWARYHLPRLYDHGLSVVDGYLMQPEYAAPYRALRARGLSHIDSVRTLQQTMRPGPGGLSVAAHPGEITPMDLGFTRLHSEAVTTLVENTVTRLGNARNYCGQWVHIMVERSAGLRNIAEDLVSDTIARPQAVAAWLTELRIRDATLRSMAEAYLRGETPREAARRFHEALQRRGIPSFTDRAGRTWNITDYTRMVTRTVCMEAETHGGLNRQMELGLDLVRVSDHAEECPRCAPWERRILSITGRTPGYRTVNEAKRAGLQHPRCGHALIPVVRGSDILRRAAA